MKAPPSPLQFPNPTVTVGRQLSQRDPVWLISVRHWFRSSCRLAAVRRWRWTGHRCIERCLYKVVGLTTCLCRYKVLLLKSHLRDMLALTRTDTDMPCMLALSYKPISYFNFKHFDVFRYNHKTMSFWGCWSFAFPETSKCIAKRLGHHVTCVFNILFWIMNSSYDPMYIIVHCISHPYVCITYKYV